MCFSRRVGRQGVTADVANKLPQPVDYGRGPTRVYDEVIILYVYMYGCVGERLQD